MNYPYYGNPYMPPMPDNLGQLRQQQMMPQQMPQMQDTDDPNVKEALRQCMHVVEKG